MVGPRPFLTTALLLGGVSLVALAGTAPALAGGDDLERRVEELERIVKEQSRTIRAQQQEIRKLRDLTKPLPPIGRPVPEDVVRGGDEPGSFKLPNSDTSIRIGGYVKGDLIYDLGPAMGDLFVAGAIPADNSAGDKRKGKFRAHARQTRFNITTWTPTEFGKVKTFVEGDFFGSGGNQVFSNSTSFRLRHAYAQVGPVLIGQTWSLFMPLAAYPSTLDFEGPTGLPFIRQGQLRYTADMGGGLELAGSLENAEFSGHDAAGSVGSDGGAVKLAIDTAPDVVLAAMYDRGGWSAKLALLGRILELDAPGAHDSEFAWGVHADAVIPTFAGDRLELDFTFGDGIGRYLIDGGGNDAFVDAKGNLDTIQAWGAAVSYVRHWTPTLESNVSWGHYEVLDTFLPTDTKRIDTLHANLIWKGSKRFRYGIEYIAGWRRFDNSDLDNFAHRIQFSGQFFFNP